MTNKETKQEEIIQEIYMHPDKIIFMKLANGDDLICLIVDQDEYKFKVFLPYKIYYSFEENEAENNMYTEMSLLSWYQSSDVRFVIPIYKQHVVSMGVPTDAYKNFYTEIAKDMFEEKLKSMTEPDESLDKATPKMQLLNEEVFSENTKLSEGAKEYYMNTYKEINKFTH